MFKLLFALKIQHHVMFGNCKFMHSLPLISCRYHLLLLIELAGTISNNLLTGYAL